MAENILMPQAGQDLEFGSVVEWRKQEGDPVAKGEVVCVIESEKVTLEIESPSDGVLLKIVVPAGQDARVLTPIGVVGQAGEKVSVEAAPAQASSSDAAEPEEEEPETLKAPPRCGDIGKSQGFGQGQEGRQGTRRRPCAGAGNRPRRTHHIQGRGGLSAKETGSSGCLGCQGRLPPPRPWPRKRD